MIKNIKKRSVSETEVTEKSAEVAGNLNKVLKKKKTENKSVQNGQDKQVKKDAPKNVKTGMKKDKDAEPKQGVNKKNLNVSKNNGKQVVNNKQNQLKSTGDTQGQTKKRAYPKHESLTADELKEKIESIVNRGELSRTAKRKLALLKKLLRVKEGKQQLTSPKGKSQKSVEVEKNKQVQNKQQNKKLQGQLDSKSKKQNKKTDTKQANQFVKKPQTEDDEDDEDEEDDMDSELSEDESDVEEEEDEEDGENEEEVEDEEESEDDEDEDEEDENKVKTNNVQPVKEKEANKTEGEPKKKRYVVFVGNLPYTITSEELKKHFLTKVSHVVNIRIPTKDGSTSRGFAYVELADNTDFEKAFALNHSMLNGRRINVQYSGANKKEGVAKNFKLNALHKAGKFAGGKNRNQQRNFPNKRK